MGALRDHRHPMMLILTLVAGLAWLGGAIWALWDSSGLQAVTEVRLGRFLGINWFGSTLLTLALYLPSQSLILACSGFGSRMGRAPGGGAPRPRWTHDLPLILWLLANLLYLWLFLGAPPLTLVPRVQFQLGAICYSTLMGATLLACVAIVARYGFPNDKARRPDAIHPPV